MQSPVKGAHHHSRAAHKAWVVRGTTVSLKLVPCSQCMVVAKLVTGTEQYLDVLVSGALLGVALEQAQSSSLLVLAKRPA